MTPPTYTCSVPGRHITLHRIEIHHSPPKSWTTNDGASSDKVSLCGTHHNEAHALLDLYVHARGLPAKDDLRTFQPFIRTICATAWARRIPGQTPYTVAHP
jgi:hypothetical protein